MFLSANFIIEVFIVSVQNVHNKGQVHNGKQKQAHTLFVD